MKTVTTYGLEVVVDPKDHYKNDKAIGHMVGILPQMIACAVLMDHDPRPLHEKFHEQYQFSSGWLPPEGAQVEDDIWLYPGDPPVYPLVKYSKGNETIIIYPSAIVAVLVDGELVKWDRMD